MLESLKYYATSAKQVFNRLKNTFSMDPSILLVSEDTQASTVNKSLDMCSSDIAERMWLHANQKHSWAIQQLSYKQEDIGAVKNYVHRLSCINETLGGPVKISSLDAGKFTLLDWISVEKALIEYRIRFLTQGPALISKADQQKQVQLLKRAGSTPYRFYCGRNSKMAWLLDKARNMELIEYLVFHGLAGGMLIGLSGVLPYWVAGSDFVVPWWECLSTLFYGGGAWAIYKSRLIEKSVFNMSWIKKISKTWDDVLNVKTPQDALLLGHVSVWIEPWRLIRDSSGDTSRGLKLPEWSPLDVLAYCQCFEGPDPALIVQTNYALRPLDEVAVPEIFVQHTETVKEPQ